MIKIGTEKELCHIQYLPAEIQEAICEDIKILDEFYGKDRDIDRDIGGFVVVCDKGEDLHINYFDKEKSFPEFTQRICQYMKKLYISGTERNIIIYERE